MSERMSFGAGSEKGHDKKRALDPDPELQIVEQVPEVTPRMPGTPADMIKIDIDDFLEQQDEIDKQKRNDKTPGLNS